MTKKTRLSGSWHKLAAVLVTVMMSLTMFPVTGLAADGTLPACAASRFGDVQRLAPHCAAVHLLADNGIVDGYEDGTFRPAQAITRAEFAKLFVLVMGLEPRPDLPARFSDVGGHWAADLGYIQAAVLADAISGFPDGTFRPDETVTRAQAITIASAWALLPGEAEAFTENIPPPTLELADDGETDEEEGSGGFVLPDLILPPYLFNPGLPGPLPPEPPQWIVTLPDESLLDRLFDSSGNPLLQNPEPLSPTALARDFVSNHPGMFTTVNPQPLPPLRLSLFELRTLMRGIVYELPGAGVDLVLHKILGFSPSYNPDGLPGDVWGTWYHVYVATALELGLMGSDVPAPIFTGPNFNGNAPMTRAEAAMVLANLLIVVTAEQAGS